MKRSTVNRRVLGMSFFSFFVLSLVFVGKAAAMGTSGVMLPKLGEDPKGALLFVIMGVCAAIMIAIVILGKKTKNDDDKTE